MPPVLLPDHLPWVMQTKVTSPNEVMKKEGRRHKYKISWILGMLQQHSIVFRSVLLLAMSIEAQNHGLTTEGGVED